MSYTIQVQVLDRTCQAGDAHAAGHLTLPAKATAVKCELLETWPLTGYRLELLQKWPLSGYRLDVLQKWPLTGSRLDAPTQIGEVPETLAPLSPEAPEEGCASA